MACIKPPLNVTEPPPRTANRLAFTLGSAAVDGATQGKITTAVPFADAKQAGNRATSEMSKAATVADVEKALATGKAALEAALSKARTPADKQSLNARLRNLKQKAVEHQVRIELHECLDAGFPRHVVTASATSTPYELAEGYALVGRKPLNSEYAGGVFPIAESDADVATSYPESVRFTSQGFPDFSPYAVATVVLDELTGDREKDFKLCDSMAGYSKRLTGHTWHHMEDGHTLVLMPTDLHDTVRHTGGIARDKNIKGMQSTFTIAALGSILRSSNTEDQ